MSRKALDRESLKAAYPGIEIVEEEADNDEPVYVSTRPIGRGIGLGAEDDDEEEEEDDDDEGERDKWDSLSLFEEAIEAMGDPVVFDADEDACSLEEARHLRQLLHRVGKDQFLNQTIRDGSISAKRLITAFGMRAPNFLEGAPEDAYGTILRLLIERELHKRRKLAHINTMEDVVMLLHKSKNILVLTGAGISTSLGIPDFRSKGSGLYSRLEGLGLSDPQEVFDIEIFKDDPVIFYSIAKEILPTTEKFSPTHAFIELLQRKGKLLTQYTQNIDNLEIKAGIKPEKLIQCHGSFATASCIKCGYKVQGETIFPDMRAGRIAKCEKCLQTLLANKKTGRKRKRNRTSDGPRKKKYSEDSSAEEEELDIREAGVVKPDIIFFGENLPESFHKRLVDHDRDKVDLLICIGTSLKVAPVSEIIGFLPEHVPQIYISKTPVTHVDFDVELLGSCDDVVVELCRLAAWDFQHEMVPSDMRVDVTIDERYPARYKFKRREHET
ncbi:NAD-dependent histone deacetylase sir2 [Rhizina undulata]